MEARKLAGAGMILASSGWVGLRRALGLRRSCETLARLLGILGDFSGAVAYAGTPFPELCAQAAEGCRGSLRAFFEELGRQAREAGGRGMTEGAMGAAGLALPEEGRRVLAELFDGFGGRDRESQLRALELAAASLERLAREGREGLELRCRSTALLGLCGGAALVLLVI